MPLIPAHGRQTGEFEFFTSLVYKGSFRVEATQKNPVPKRKEKKRTNKRNQGGFTEHGRICRV